MEAGLVESFEMAEGVEGINEGMDISGDLEADRPSSGMEQPSLGDSPDMGDLDISDAPDSERPGEELPSLGDEEICEENDSGEVREDDASDEDSENDDSSEGDGNDTSDDSGEKENSEEEVEEEKKGGRFKDVYKEGEGDTHEVHHMPADSASDLDRNDGPAIKMEKGDHRQTASCGNSKEAQEYREKQRELISQGRFREALQMDIDDIHEKFGDKYDDAIEEMLEYVEELEEEGRI